MEMKIEKKVRAMKIWHDAGEMESVCFWGMVHWHFGVRCMSAVDHKKCFWWQGSFRDFTFFFSNIFSILSTIISAIDQVAATHKADTSAMECATIPWTPQLGSIAAIQRIRCCWVWIWHWRKFINKFWHLMQERQQQFQQHQFRGV